MVRLTKQKGVIYGLLHDAAVRQDAKGIREGLRALRRCVMTLAKTENDMTDFERGFLEEHILSEASIEE